MDFGDIALAGIGGAVTGWAGNQIKENDAAKVQEETLRREKLLEEKEKRQAATAEYNTLRERGWKVEDADRKRGQELEDQDTKYVNEAAKTAGERAFLSGQTDKQIASHERIANIQNNAAELRAKLSEEKENARETKAELRERRLAAREISKAFLTWQESNPGTNMTEKQFAAKHMSADYAIAYPDEQGGEPVGTGLFGQIAKDLSFNKTAPNQGKGGGTVEEPAPLDETVIDGYGKRPNGTAKGKGFMGEIPTKDGKVMTELTIGVNIDGKEVDIPSIVPTLTKAELKHLQDGGKPTKEIVRKAVEYAKGRMNYGKSVYAEGSEAPASTPQPAEQPLPMATLPGVRKPAVDIDSINRQLIRDPSVVDVDSIVSQIESGKLNVLDLNLSSLENLLTVLSKRLDRKGLDVREEVSEAIKIKSKGQ